MKDQRGSAGQCPVHTGRPPTRHWEGDSGDSIQEVICTRMIRTGNDLPAGAVPMLDQRLPMEVGVVISGAPKFNRPGHMGYVK